MSALDRHHIPYESTGVHPPVHALPPSQLDMKRNAEMIAWFVKNTEIIETKEGWSKRMKAMDKLQRLVTEWAYRIGVEKKVPPEYLIEGGGIQLRIFGSTRLNVLNPDSDIDVLCLAPSFISRQDFFDSFVALLRERHDVDSISAIPEAYTPVVKLVIDSLPIDIIFASLCNRLNPQTNMPLPATIIPPNFNVLHVHCLWGMDDQSVRSVNGSRVAERILSIVHNVPNFCETLRIIKYWARQRGIYSNVLGFLGGVNFAILVAFVSLLFPNACPFTLVGKFFSVFSVWKWPSPIIIADFEDLKLTDTDGRYLPVWNPKMNYKDGLHIMPIITPAYPAMNSSYNVGPPQFRYIKEEIIRANMIFQNQSKQPHNSTFKWITLVEACTREFFINYPRYVQIDISAPSQEDHRNWFGFVESRLRTFIVSLEQPPVVSSHPMANCFHRTGSFDASTTSKDTTSSVYISPPARMTSHKSDSDIDLLRLNLASATKPATSENASSATESSCDESSATAAVEQAKDTASAVSDAVAGNQSLSTPYKAATAASDVSQNFVSSFFIGLSFQIGATETDVTPAVNEFLSRVNGWSAKKSGMQVTITLRERTEIPSWVYDVKAEPSNVRSCTPKPKQPLPLQQLSVPSNGLQHASADHTEDSQLANRLVNNSSGATVGVGSNPNRNTLSEGVVRPSTTGIALGTVNSGHHVNPAKVLFKDEVSPSVSVNGRTAVPGYEGKPLNISQIFTSVASSNGAAIVRDDSGAAVSNASISSAPDNRGSGVTTKEVVVTQQGKHKKNDRGKNRKTQPNTSASSAGNASASGAGDGSSKSVVAAASFVNDDPNDFPPLNGKSDSGKFGMQSSKTGAAEEQKREHSETHNENGKTSWSQDHQNKQHHTQHNQNQQQQQQQQHLQQQTQQQQQQSQRSPGGVVDVTSSPMKKAKKELAAEK